jgi:hypothetical protein
MSYKTNKMMLENKEKALQYAIVNPDVKKSFKEFLKLNKEEFALCGGLAVSVYTQPRTTMDVDILIHGNIETILDQIKSKFKKLSSFSVEDKKSGVEIEMLTGRVINTEQTLIEAAIKNANDVEFEGSVVKVISPKYLIALKLGRAVKNIPRKSAMDVSDIEGLVSNYGKIDIEDLNLPKEQIEFYNSLCDRVSKYKEANKLLGE